MKYDPPSRSFINIKQYMLNKPSLLCLFFLVQFFIGCSQNKPVNVFVYRTMASNLSRSNLDIDDQIRILQIEFTKDSPDSQRQYAIKQWQPKALQIQELSHIMTNYLDQLKMDLKHLAGLKMVNDREYWEEDNFTAVDKLFQIKGKADSLKQEILKYETAVLSIDENMNAAFKEKINEIIVLADKTAKDKTFAETFFSNIPTVAAFAILQKFTNDVKNFELQLITYCYNQALGK